MPQTLDGVALRFELSRLPSYDDASIVAELQRVAELIPAGGAVTIARFNSIAKVDASTVKKRFGGWQAALAAAGLSGRYSGRSVSSKMREQGARDMSNANLLAELRRVADVLGSASLSQPEFNSNSDISASVMRGRFGSWSAALRAAGLTPLAMGRRYSEDDYFENLLTVWTHHGRQPVYREMDAPPSSITAGAYEKRWGSWTRALVAFVERVNSDVEPAASAPAGPVAAASAAANPADRRKIPLGLRYDVLRRDNFKCTVCGNSPAVDSRCVLHVDHIVPFARGGRTVEANLRSLCAACNIGKSDKL